MSREGAKEDKEIEGHADSQFENGDASLKLWSDSKETYFRKRYAGMTVY